MKRTTTTLIALLGALLCLNACASQADDQTIQDLKDRVALLRTAPTGSGAQDLATLIESELLLSGNQYDLSPEEQESLQYLYAYMPVNDMAEHPFAFFVDITKQAFQTKQLPWGETVTPELFRYYVLPPRVNNETLDNARETFYNELYPRIKDLSMYDAVLEVNHWCREKIVYQPTDGRTTQPTRTVNRAYGRCGEESTVTVTALRSVGIPARQVYVPLWAHTNSNHAWVEVWVDGTWYYLGACEPEPLLDRGWFTASASRAMLVNSYAYGPLVPDEKSQIKGEIISHSALFTEVSSTATYAPVKKAVVKVVDASGKPLKGASVRFCIINGNSLSAMAQRVTASDGTAFLTTGLGTFLLETLYEENGKTYYAERLLSVKDVDTLEVQLTRDERLGAPDGGIAHADYAITPPPETRFPKALTEAQQKAHDARCATDDSIRLAHTAGFRFTTEAQARAYAATIVAKGLPKTAENALVAVLAQSLSGGVEIEKFLNNTPADQLELAVQLLGVIRPKDIHEITAETYADYLQGVVRLGDAYQDTPEYRQSILNPRIGNEIPIAYKQALWDLLAAQGMKEAGSASALEAVKKALDNVLLVDTQALNPRNFYMTPLSVAQFGMADNANYANYARALLATAGIPSRMNGMSGPLNVMVDGQWQPLALKSDSPVETAVSEGTAILRIEDPQGEANGMRYSLQRWTGNGYRPVGRFNMMPPTGGRQAGGRGSQGPQNNTMEAGMYRLLTSMRAADGSMLAHIMTFTVAPDSKQTITAGWYATKEDELVVIGSMDVEWKYTAKDAPAHAEPTSILNTVGRNFFVLAFLEPTKEPSQHFIREFSDRDLKMPVLFLFNDAHNMDFFFKQGYRMNEKIHYGYDGQQVILNGLSRSLSATDLAARLPVVIVADSFGNIYYKSIGYNIGVPETISKLKLPLHQE